MPKWQLTGDYFENCNCDVVCPCLASTAAPLTARPSRGACDVALVFHIDKGSYGGLALDGLNVALAAHAPGPMADGNWAVAAYIDERADDRQTRRSAPSSPAPRAARWRPSRRWSQPSSASRKCRSSYAVQGKSRSVEIPGIMQMAVEPIPTMHPGGEIWTALGHPVAPDRLALAVGRRGSTFADHGMRWDNSGRNGHYAPISWSN